MKRAHAKSPILCTYIMMKHTSLYPEDATCKVSDPLYIHHDEAYNKSLYPE